jgi:hypothetical protein
VSIDAVDELRPHPVRHALKLSAGFGGANAALVLGEPRARAAGARRPVRVVGVSAVGPHGLTLEIERPLVGRAVDFALERIVRSAPKRELDPSSKVLTAAAQLALDDAKVAVRGPLRVRAGLFTGTSRMPARSTYECWSSVDKRGIRSIAAAPFTQMVLNAPAGTCAKLHALKGPLLVVSAGRASGLLAIVRAAQHLSERNVADLVVAGGHEELPIDPAAADAEGAACAVLSATQPGGIVLAGWGVSGSASDAVSRAMAAVPEVDGVFAALPVGVDVPPNVARTPLGVFDVTALAGGTEAASSAIAFVLAVRRLRQKAARVLLVVSATDALACAAVLKGDPDGQ